MEFEKIKSIIAEQLGVEESKITMDSSFVDDLGADSLDLVDIILAFEQEFDIEVPEDLSEEISTVGDAVEYIKNLKN